MVKYNVDFQKCTSTLLCDAQNKAVSFDIAYHPNGKLYIISDSGRLNEVNTLNGAITRIHDFSGQTYTSLVTDANGKFYATGRSGLLFTYDIQNDIEVYLGNIGYSAAGDLTFYNGNLYMAAMKNKLVQIDINNPANSFVIMDINTSHSVFGIFSYGNKCEEIDPYLVAQNEIYKIDFIKKSLTFICKLDFDVAGGASTYEFYGSNPIEIQSISVKNPICTNDNGSININSNGGIGKLQYSIDGNQFSDKNEFLGLPSGKYTIYVKDQNGCYISESIELVLEKNIQINVLGQTNASCDHNNGTLSVSASGGKLTIEQTGAPKISSLAINDASCNIGNGSIFISGIGGNGVIQYSLDGINFQLLGNFTNLLSGNYEVTIKDESECRYSQNITIQERGQPQILSLIQKDAYCDLNNGIVNVVGTNGEGDLKYSLDGISFFQYGLFGSLSPGPYTVYIRDTNNCTFKKDLFISQMGKPKIVNMQVLHPTCDQNNGIINVEVNGGIGPLFYSLNNMDFQSSNVFSNLEPGKYELIIQDSTKCRINQEFILAKGSNLKITNIIVESEKCDNSNGTIRLMTNGGTGNFRYSLNQIFTESTNYFTNLKKGEYNISVIDSLNCIADTTISITNNCDIFLPNVFSPNGDGVNDYFSIYNSYGAESIILLFSVFDRWGNLVFERKNLLIDKIDFHLWDGTSNGIELVPGVYVYNIEILNSNNNIIRNGGEITILK